jgi:hypothetical protein
VHSVVKAWACCVARQALAAQATCMLIPMSPEFNFLYVMQERMREAEADRLANLARQRPKVQRVGVGDSERKDQG